LRDGGDVRQDRGGVQRATVTIGCVGKQVMPAWRHLRFSRTERKLRVGFENCYFLPAKFVSDSRTDAVVNECCIEWW
jgi:hypothetical protein